MSKYWQTCIAPRDTHCLFPAEHLLQFFLIALLKFHRARHLQQIGKCRFVQHGSHKGSASRWMSAEMIGLLTSPSSQLW